MLFVSFTRWFLFLQRRLLIVIMKIFPVVSIVVTFCLLTKSSHSYLCYIRDIDLCYQKVRECNASRYCQKILLEPPKDLIVSNGKYKGYRNGLSEAIDWIRSHDADPVLFMNISDSYWDYIPQYVPLKFKQESFFVKWCRYSEEFRLINQMMEKYRIKWILLTPTIGSNYLPVDVSEKYLFMLNCLRMNLNSNIGIFINGIMVNEMSIDQMIEMINTLDTDYVLFFQDSLDQGPDSRWTELINRGLNPGKIQPVLNLYM